MTYEELGREIAQMTYEQKCQTVTVYCTGIDEYIPVKEIDTAKGEETDILDEGHVIFII